MTVAPGQETARRNRSGRWGFLKDVRIRLTLSIVLVTLSVSVLGLFINLGYDEYRLRQAAVETNLVRLQALKIDFVKVLSGNVPDSAAELVDRISIFSDIRNMLLHRDDGRHVFRYDRDPSDMLDLRASIDIQNSSAIVHGDDGLLLNNPVDYEGKHYGWVTVRVDTVGRQGLLRSYLVTVLLLVAGTLLIAIVLSVLVGYYFTRPIGNLAAFTRRVTQSRDFDQQIHSRYKGETGDLYDGMNALMNEISSAQREIHRLNESRIRKIIESSLDGVVSMNADGLVTYWGRQNISIFGWLEAEVLGQPLEEFIIPERFRKRHRDGLQNFLASGHASILNRRIEVFGLHRDGHELPIEISLSAIKEKQGWTFNAFIRDLSELRETETELRDAQIRLLRKERLATVGQLTATVAHELRTPMGTIRNSMFTLARKLGKNDSSTVQLIERVDRNVQRCDAIISQLLDFARDREIRVQPTAIAGWLDRLLDGYDLPQQVELVRNFPAAAYALMDPAYFESAVVNVLDNAVHAVSERYPQGGGRIEVGIECESGRVAVVVSDNGPGIAADDIELVMEPLFSTKVYGVGLGLPTVKKIMEKHGGEVVLGSNDGGGVRVCLWLMASRLKRAIKMSPDDNEDVLPRSVL